MNVPHIIVPKTDDLKITLKKGETIATHSNAVPVTYETLRDIVAYTDISAADVRLRHFQAQDLKDEQFKVKVTDPNEELSD
jgi:hypothetical protein